MFFGFKPTRKPMTMTFGEAYLIIGFDNDFHDRVKTRRDREGMDHPVSWVHGCVRGGRRRRPLCHQRRGETTSRERENDNK